jgi:hypothetical protein
MRSDTGWSVVLRPIFWFSSDARSRRRDLKTLASLEERSLATRSDLASINERATAGATHLADHRRTFEQAHQAVQDSQAELQKLIEQVGAISGSQQVKPKAVAAP